MPITDLSDLNEKVSIFDVLDFMNIKYISRAIDSQIICPIHKEGQEMSPSAKVYSSTNSIYCFTCHKTYTPLDLVMAKFDFNVPNAVNFITTKFHYHAMALTDKPIIHKASRREADNTWIVVNTIATDYMTKNDWPIALRLESWRQLDSMVFGCRDTNYGDLIKGMISWLDTVKSS